MTLPEFPGTRRGLPHVD